MKQQNKCAKCDRKLQNKNKKKKVGSRAKQTKKINTSLNTLLILKKY